MSDNIIKFKQAMEKLKSDALEDTKHAEYMSDMSNWLTVHATRYIPLRDKAGNMYIPTTAMAEYFKGYPRNTVHTTMNHVVAGHGYGNWDDVPIVILVPYKSIVDKNGNPAEVAGTDTYWSVDPDKGLQLSSDTVIVQPDNNGPLYHIGDKIVTYKTDNYTDEEVQQILSMLNKYDRMKYDKYMNGDFDELDIKSMLYNEVVEKAYNNAKDKNAFLRGLMEEDRFAILSHFLRNAVVKLAVQNMGYEYVECYDMGAESRAIAQTANENGMVGNISNKGHSNSIYKAMEEVYGSIDSVVNGNWLYSDGLYVAKNADELYQYITDSGFNWNRDMFVSAVISGKPVDVYSLFVKKFNRFDTLNNNDSYKTIAEFDPFLDKTLHRTAQEVEKTFMQWMDKIKQWPDYDKLISKLKSYQMAQHMQRAGHEL